MKKINKLTKHNIFQILVLILIAINFGIAISYIAILISSIENDSYRYTDFAVFYTGGEIIHDSLGSRLYDSSTQAQYQLNILQGRSFKDGILRFNYPPYVAILIFYPLAYLPLKVAFYVWTIFQFVLIGWLIVLLKKMSQGWESLEKGFLIAASSAMPALLITLLFGHLSLLMLISTLQLYLAVKSNQEYRVGFWLSVLAFKPQFFIIPAIVLLGIRKWRALITSLLIGIFLFILSTVFLGWRIWMDFAQILTLSSTFYNRHGIYPGFMYNLRGVLTLILGANNADIINTISFLALVVTVFMVYIMWRGKDTPFDYRFELRLSLTILLAIILNVHVYHHDSLILIASLALFFHYQILQGIQHKLYVLFLLSIPLIFLLIEVFLNYAFIFRIPILTVVILIAWISINLFREKDILSERLKVLRNMKT